MGGGQICPVFFFRWDEVFSVTAIAVYYIIMLAWAIFHVGQICWAGRRENAYRLLLAVSVMVTNAGLLAGAMTENVGTEALALKMTYAGLCFVPLFALLLTVSVCGLRIFEVTKIFLASFACVTLMMSFTIGHSELFAGNLRNETVGNAVLLEYDYGPLHGFFIAYTCLLIAFALGFVIYALYHQTRVSYKTVSAMGIMLFAGFLICLAEYLFRNEISFVPLYYNVSMTAIILLTGRMNLYDIRSNVIESMDRLDEYGYLALDRKRRFMGANDLARRYFPEFNDFRIDYRVPEEIEAGPNRQIYDWLRQLAPDTSLLPRKFEVDEKILRFSVTTMRHRRWVQGYLVEFKDVTKEDRSAEMMRQFNEDLKNEVREQTEHINYIKDMLVLGMASMVDSRDNSTGGHIRRTSAVVTIISKKLMQNESEKRLGVTEKFLSDVAKAAPMHDLGKIAVDDRVLRKKGKYTPEEYAEMKKHPAEGAKIVRDILTGVEDPEFVKIAENVAHYHHEKWNGEGYPEGLSGTDIPLEARIMALADVFDALVSKRYYKDAYSYDTAFGIIVDSLGSHFDPYLGKAFLSCRKELEELYDGYVEHGDDARTSMQRRRQIEQEMEEEAGKTVNIRIEKKEAGEKVV